MNFQITKDQNYCTFDGVVVFEYVSSVGKPIANICDNCAFRDQKDSQTNKDMCHSVPCVGWKRNDKDCGFWIHSHKVRINDFKKMIESE